ncbi:DUF3958 family protein [Enterococcus quebecensis]|uniref:Flagellar FliJ protein n=1 Tax=Enterococcus quebecensis TaxID=903983 RepID=A0A1E5GUV8_9ENTE|nr:DUF3958 family protein [Enterococcus quebecensis]OEG16461.1 hypothetical protein BCR23_06120 [Enterococcus quebecensis]OJG74172.1 hypothetical protein RV12_GL002810 [Enterococcus quebecensis]
MNVQEKELKINQQLRQVAMEQENICREIRELEELEADYFSIHQQEQRYYQELIENNQGSRYISHFIELDEEAKSFHQYERQRLEDIAERLVKEEFNLRNKEEALYIERKQLFVDEEQEDA